MARERRLISRYARDVFAQYQALASGLAVFLLVQALNMLDLEIPSWVSAVGIVAGIMVAQFLAWRSQVLRGIENYQPDVGEGLELSREWPVMQHHNGRLPHGLGADLKIITAPSELLALRVVCSAPILEGYCTALPHGEVAEAAVLRQDTARFSFRDNLLPAGTKIYLSVSSSQPIHLMEISLVPLGSQ